MISRDEKLGKVDLRPSKKFWGACSSVEVLKGCMVRERLGTPALAEIEASRIK